jgi:citrate synthase
MSIAKARKPWLGVDEALSRLNVRRQTLYAYVSRGLIRAQPDGDDPRRSLYSAHDIGGLAGRRRGARRRSEVAAGAIAWGEPVLESAISTVRGGQLVYRGRNVVALSERATLEETAALLWGGEVAAYPDDAPRLRKADSGVQRAFALLSVRAGEDAPSLDRGEAALRVDAWSLLHGVGVAFTGEARGAMHQRLAKAWGLNARGADMVRRVLVLQADHELNASTFSVRVAASTGAPLAACCIAGLATLTGPLHGQAAARGLAQFDEVLAARTPEEGVARLLARGERLAVGHQLYPDGDVRAKAMMKALRPRAAIARVVAAMENGVGLKANCDASLAAMVRELELPDDAAFTMFALARMTGWLAHAMEQRATGALIRPRAKYVGV